MKFLSAASLLALLALGIVSATTTRLQTTPAERRAPSESVKYQLVTNAITTPVQLIAVPDKSGRSFICDLAGKIFILKNGRLLPRPLIDLGSLLAQKDTAAAMRAVFSIACHPDFAANKKFYACYNAPATDTADKCKLRVSEFTINPRNPDNADISSERVVFEISGSTVGVDDCQIAFGPDGYLYISIGDNGTPMEKREAQQLNSYLGKLLRIDVNKAPYAIPADNPFVNTKNAKAEIWSYGLRRLWRFSFDPVTRELIGADIGDKLEEEIDIIQKGGNYGWPIKEGSHLAVSHPFADTSQFIAPINTYPHLTGICIIGGYMYQGKSLPFLKNKYVFADFNGTLFALTREPNKQWSRQTLTLTNPPAEPMIIYSVDQDQDNEIFVLGVVSTATGSKGVVYKLVKG